MQILGILNITPDSFSDGGRVLRAGGRPDIAEAVRLAERMIADGAHAVDVGGVSTRPGAADVGVQEELDRVIPVVEALRGLDVWVDTSRGEVARAALAAGACAVNDQRAGADPDVLAAVAEAGCRYVLMHNRGTPQTMRALAQYADVCSEVWGQLDALAARAVDAGVRRDKLVLDPGIGFAKTAAHSLDVLRELPGRVPRTALPVLVGASRKSFLGGITGRADPGDRLPGSLAVAIHAQRAGVAWVRVHDVAATRDALLVAAALEPQ
jgi:dihydropteroate synthase